MKQFVGTLALWGLVLVAVAACQTDARQQLMATSGTQVALRSMQTRAFDTTDRVKTLTTVIATLQDLEFLIDRADASLGVVTATKTKRLAQLRMSVTIHPRGSDQTLVRASGQFKLEAVDDPAFYQQFFAALERAMFLTAHEVGAPTGVSGSPREAPSKGLIPAAATRPLETRLSGSTEVKARAAASGSSLASFSMAAVPTKTATSPNASPFDGAWSLEVGVAGGSDEKDRVLVMVIDGRFSAQFKTAGWTGRLEGEIDESKVLAARGTVDRNGTWYSKGALKFEARYKRNGFRKIVASKARVSESFDFALTR